MDERLAIWCALAFEETVLHDQRVTVHAVVNATSRNVMHATAPGPRTVLSASQLPHTARTHRTLPPTRHQRGQEPSCRMAPRTQPQTAQAVAAMKATSRMSTSSCLPTSSIGRKCCDNQPAHVEPSAAFPPKDSSPATSTSSAQFAHCHTEPSAQRHSPDRTAPIQHGCLCAQSSWTTSFAERSGIDAKSPPSVARHSFCASSQICVCNSSL
mmetsp:Transcript_16253/g.47097  ORF Transcript_16253/g.47097 Transcript_16253/m.47097 type:complete len:212 (-) Transcript_16253:114-749(-)